MYSRFQLQTPVIAIEGLAILPEEEFLKNLETVGYCFTLYKVWEDYRPKQTLKSLLLK